MDRLGCIAVERDGFVDSLATVDVVRASDNILSQSEVRIERKVVIAWPAIDEVPPHGARYTVVPVASLKRIVTETAIEIVPSTATQNDIVALSSIEADVDPTEMRFVITFAGYDADVLNVRDCCAIRNDQNSGIGAARGNSNWIRE